MRNLGWISHEAAKAHEAVNAAGPAGAAQPPVATSEGSQGHPPPSGLLEELRRHARTRLGAPSALRPFAEEIWKWNVLHGADPAGAARWEAVTRGEGVCVITGQQPTLWGGPLYSLYKLLTAVALAGRLEADLGVPALAVFWVVGDDADFGEVSSCWIPRPGGQLLKVRDPDVPSGGMLVGRLPASRQSALLDEHEPVLRQHARGEITASLLRDALTRAADWSAVQAAVFFRLLPGVPFVVLDGGRPDVLAAGREALLRWHETLPMESLLSEGAALAARQGWEPAFVPEEARSVIFEVAGGKRVPVPRPAGGSSTGGPANARDAVHPPETPGASDNGEGADAGRPAQVATGGVVAPNVLLRPVLQDYLLPNAATIGGPSEIRYRAQLAPVYRACGVPPPPVLPRLTALLVPLPHAPLSRETRDVTARTRDLAAEAEEMAADPEGYVERAQRAFRPHAALDRVTAMRSSVGAELEALGAELESYDASLRQVVDSARAKTDYQLGRIVEGLEGKARHRLFRAQPWLTHLREFLRPRDGQQERTLTLLAPFLLEENAAEILEQAAREHLERLLAEAPQGAGTNAGVSPSSTSKPSGSPAQLLLGLDSTAAAAMKGGSA